MLIAVIGENASGKTTLAAALQDALGAEIVSGRDYLRMAKSESEALSLFRQKLRAAVAGKPLVYVVSEPELVRLLPEEAVRILVSADLATIKERFRARLHGNLPEPVARMLEDRHGQFDGGNYDYRFDGAAGDPAALCGELKKRMGAEEE